MCCYLTKVPDHLAHGGMRSKRLPPGREGSQLVSTWGQLMIDWNQSPHCSSPINLIFQLLSIRHYRTHKCFNTPNARNLTNSIATFKSIHVQIRFFRSNSLCFSSFVVKPAPFVKFTRSGERLALKRYMALRKRDHIYRHSGVRTRNLEDEERMLYSLRHPT